MTESVIMEENVMTEEKKIRKNVFTWYSKHKNDCDERYSNACSPNILDLYVEVNDEVEKQKLFSKTDLVILTANIYERNALHQNSCQSSREKIKTIELKLNTPCNLYRTVSAYSFSCCGYTILNIHSWVTGAYTNGGAADVIRYVLSNEYLYPSAIISFGICFGTKEGTFELGDVILSEKVYPYFVGVKVKGKNWEVNDNNVLKIDDSLGHKIMNLKSYNQFPKDSLGFTVEYGNYITGEAVVSSKTYRDLFTAITKQKIIAGDMEAYGVFKECQTPPYSIPCIVLKSICDWGIEKNYDKNDAKVVEDYCKYVLNCSVPVGGEPTCEEIGLIIDTIMDRIQAYTAKNAFYVLEILLKTSYPVFGHSAYYVVKHSLQTCIENKTWCDDDIKEIINSVLSNNASKSVFERTVLTMLKDEGIIYNLQFYPESTQINTITYTFETKKQKNPVC